jgi:hypothetical protein
MTTGESPPANVFEVKRLRKLGWVGFGVLGFLEMKTTGGVFRTEVWKRNNLYSLSSQSFLLTGSFRASRVPKPLVSQNQTLARSLHPCKGKILPGHGRRVPRLVHFDHAVVALCFRLEQHFVACQNFEGSQGARRRLLGFGMRLPGFGRPETLETRPLSASSREILYVSSVVPKTRSSAIFALAN